MRSVRGTEELVTYQDRVPNNDGGAFVGGCSGTDTWALRVVPSPLLSWKDCGRSYLLDGQRNAVRAGEFMI